MQAVIVKTIDDRDKGVHAIDDCQNETPSGMVQYLGARELGDSFQRLTAQI